MFARLCSCTPCIHDLRSSILCCLFMVRAILNSDHSDPRLCSVSCEQTSTEIFCAKLVMAYCISSDVCKTGILGKLLGLQQLCFHSHGSQENVFCWKEVKEETLYQWNSALLITQSSTILFFEHILFDCITVWEASFDFILNRFVPIWPEPELSYWRWQMNGSHVIGFKKMHGRWTAAEYSQDCLLYSLDSS